MKSEEFTNNLDEEIIDEWSDTHPGINKVLKAKGYKRLGSGVDQTAYLEPGTGQVLKIFGTQSGTSGSGGHQLSEDQKMFVNWAKYCEKNAGNPFLPKFSGFERFVYEDQTYFQIRQERLANTGDAFREACAEIASEVEGGYASSVKELVAEFKAQAAEDDGIGWHSTGYYYNKMIQRFGEAGAYKFLATIYELNKIAMQKGYTLDLHSGNFMMRGKTPVIVDPWVHPSGL